VTLQVTVEGGPGEVSSLAALHSALEAGLYLLLVSLAPVQLSLSLCLKLGLTLLTLKSKTSSMKLEVRVEVVDSGEVLIAALDVAAEIFVTFMAQFVPVQFVPGHECPVTAWYVTLEGFDIVMREEMQLELVSLAVGLITVL